MAGLIGNVSGLSSSGLGGFLVGSTAATSSGRVEQSRSRLSFDYGDILNGAAADGTLFDIRVNNPFDFEFGSNLSFKSRFRPGVVDSGDTLALDATLVRKRLEQHDIARVAFGLLLASKGDISAAELASNPIFKDFYALEPKDAFDRLNVDSERSFRVNGAEFRFQDGAIRLVRRPGEPASRSDRVDPEIDRLRRRLDQRQQTLSGGMEVEKKDVAGASINRLVGVREELEANYTFVAYDFANEAFIASDRFSDIMPALTQVPDAFFFGANIAYQMEMALGNDISEGAKNELFPVMINYFASLGLGALTGLPNQLRTEFEQHAGTVLSNLYRGDEAKVNGILDTLRPLMQRTYENVVDAVSFVPMGADVETLREGIGAAFGNGIYSLRKFVTPY